MHVVFICSLLLMSVCYGQNDTLVVLFDRPFPNHDSQCCSCTIVLPCQQLQGSSRFIFYPKQEVFVPINRPYKMYCNLQYGMRIRMDSASLHLQTVAVRPLVRWLPFSGDTLYINFMELLSKQRITNGWGFRRYSIYIKHGPLFVLGVETDPWNYGAPIIQPTNP